MGIAFNSAVLEEEITSKIVYLSRENLFTPFYFVILLFWGVYVFVSLAGNKSLFCLSDCVKKTKISRSMKYFTVPGMQRGHPKYWLRALYFFMDNFWYFHGDNKTSCSSFKKYTFFSEFGCALYICTQWEVQLISILQSFTRLPNQNSTLMKLHIKYLALWQTIYASYVSANYSVRDPVLW